MGVLYLIIGVAFGAIITYLRMDNSPLAKNEEFIKLKNTDRSLDKRIKSEEAHLQRLEDKLKATKATFDLREIELQRFDAELATIKAQMEEPTIEKPAQDPIPKTEPSIVDRTNEVEPLMQQIETLSAEKSDLASDITSLEEANLQVAEKIVRLEKELEEKTAQYDELDQFLIQEKAAHEATKKQLKEQRTSFEALGKKFNSDFQNMASKILDELEPLQKTK